MREIIVIGGSAKQITCRETDNEESKQMSEGKKALLPVPFPTLNEIYSSESYFLVPGAE